MIVPAFNREGTIQRAVQSVLDQTYRPCEVIVVDDGSTDHTFDMLKSYGNRIRLIRQVNQGPSSARNTGIRAARGDIISFLDSDDAWYPRKLERQMTLLEKTRGHGVQCCITNARMLRRDGSEKTSFAVAGLFPRSSEGLWINPAEVLLTRFLLFNQTVAVRRTLLEQAGYFNTQLRVLEDYELALRLSLSGSWAFLGDPLVIWYGGAENSLSEKVRGLEELLRTDEIISGLSYSERWGPLMPKPIVDRHRALLKRRIWAYRLSNRAHGLLLVFVRCILFGVRMDKWLYYRSPFCPRMMTREI